MSEHKVGTEEWRAEMRERYPLDGSNGIAYDPPRMPTIGGSLRDVALCYLAGYALFFCVYKPIMWVVDLELTPAVEVDR